MALSREQKALRKAALLFGQKFGVGGSLWTVSAVSGNGVSGPVSAGDIGVVTAYVSQVKPSQLAQSLAGSVVPVARWDIVAAFGDPIDPATLSAEDLQTHQEIESLSDPTLRFTIKDIDTTGGYVEGILEPL